MYLEEERKKNTHLFRQRNIFTIKLKNKLSDNTINENFWRIVYENSGIRQTISLSLSFYTCLYSSFIGKINKYTNITPLLYGNWTVSAYKRNDF